MTKVQIYEDLEGQWRWRAVAANGRIIADGAEGYDSAENVARAIKTVVEFFTDTFTVERHTPHAKPPADVTGTTLSG